MHERASSELATVSHIRQKATAAHLDTNKSNAWRDRRLREPIRSTLHMLGQIGLRVRAGCCRQIPLCQLANHRVGRVENIPQVVTHALAQQDARAPGVQTVVLC